MGCETLDTTRLNNKGVNYLEDGDYDSAIIQFSKAIELDPNYAEGHQGRGEAYFRKKHLDDALSDLNTAVELSPLLVDARYYRGLVYFEKEQYENAIKDFNAAIEQIKAGTITALGQKEYATPYYYRGLTYMRLEQYEKALADFSLLATRGFGLGNIYGDVHFHRAQCFEKVGRSKDALKSYRVFVNHTKSKDDIRTMFANTRIEELTKK